MTYIWEREKLPRSFSVTTTKYKQSENFTGDAKIYYRKEHGINLFDVNVRAHYEQSSIEQFYHEKITPLMTSYIPYLGDT
ncbi:unnamed protein product [Rhizophagus irregularis]|nr:unnamed protein product [Rhizophagus irregularis]